MSNRKKTPTNPQPWQYKTGLSTLMDIKKKSWIKRIVNKIKSKLNL